MANYVKSTNFASKDSLPSGDPAKIVKGTEIDTEFNNIATAVGTKADLISPTFTGTPTAPTASPGTNTTQLATTAYVLASQGTIASQNANNVAITGGSITGITDLAIADGGTGASTASAAFNNLKQAATDSATGVVELATTAEAETGTDTTRAVTPAGVEAHMVANALGWGQTWQNVTGSRSAGVTYTNSTGRPITVFMTPSTGTAGTTVEVGSVVLLNNIPTNAPITFIVPNGAAYSISGSAGISRWVELR